MSEHETARCKRVLSELQQQERKLLQAYYADNLSAELFAEEQRRLQREREQTEAITRRLEVDFEDIERTLDLALALVDDIDRAYRVAPDDVRRLLNQAIFERIDVLDDPFEQVRMTSELREPFASLAQGWDVVPTPTGGRNGKGPDPVGSRPFARGSSKEQMVGETGFEPATARPPAGCATRLRHSPICPPTESGRRESNPP